MSYFPWVLCAILLLKCTLLLHQNFGKLNLLMQISFIILFMIIYTKTTMCMHVYVHLLTFSLKKNFSSETIDWTFTKFNSVP